MIKMGVPYNMDMLKYIKEHEAVDFNELCTKFGNGIGRIVEMDIDNLLENTLITKDSDGKYRAL